jgi:hypothetical protein
MQQEGATKQEGTMEQVGITDEYSGELTRGGGETMAKLR